MPDPTPEPHREPELESPVAWRMLPDKMKDDLFDRFYLLLKLSVLLRRFRLAPVRTDQKIRIIEHIDKAIEQLAEHIMGKLGKPFLFDAVRFYRDQFGEELEIVLPEKPEAEEESDV